MASSSATVTGKAVTLDLKASVTIDNEVLNIQGMGGTSASTTIRGNIRGKTIILEAKATVTIDTVPASTQDSEGAPPDPKKQRLELEPAPRVLEDWEYSGDEVRLVD